MAREYVTEDGKPWEGNLRESEGYRALMAEIRMEDFHDPYAVSSGWLVALAECVYVHSGEVLQDFGPSPMLEVGNLDTLHWDENPEGRVAEMFDYSECDLDDMRRVYAVMYRYDTWVCLAGRNY